jgi:hypothetical protein
MLVDLGRNDVGKVSKSGSVVVEKLMEIERYSHVMHISSTVTGQLQPGLDSWDALRAALPAGTVSGAPKVSRRRREYQKGAGRGRGDIRRVGVCREAVVVQWGSCTAWL